MGRKERNKIKKEKKDEDNIEEHNYFEDEEKEKEIIQEVYEKNQFDIIWKTRMSMIKYCEKLSIPMCEYLTNDIFERFIEKLL